MKKLILKKSVRKTKILKNSPEELIVLETELEFLLDAFDITVKSFGETVDRFCISVDKDV